MHNVIIPGGCLIPLLFIYLYQALIEPYAVVQPGSCCYHCYCRPNLAIHCKPPVRKNAGMPHFKLTATHFDSVPMQDLYATQAGKIPRTYPMFNQSNHLLEK